MTERELEYWKVKALFEMVTGGILEFEDKGEQELMALWLSKNRPSGEKEKVK